jgi:flagellar biosynthesis/type III secretory pathway M-ring protein FliF/YscJ
MKTLRWIAGALLGVVALLLGALGLRQLQTERQRRQHEHELAKKDEARIKAESDAALELAVTKGNAELAEEERAANREAVDGASLERHRERMRRLDRDGG